MPSTPRKESGHGCKGRDVKDVFKKIHEQSCFVEQPNEAGPDTPLTLIVVSSAIDVDNEAPATETLETTPRRSVVLSGVRQTQLAPSRCGRVLLCSVPTLQVRRENGERGVDIEPNRKHDKAARLGR